MGDKYDNIIGIFLIISLIGFGLLIGSYIIPLYLTDESTSEEQYIMDRENVDIINYNSDLTIDEAQNGVVTIFAKQENTEDGIESQGSGFMYSNNHIMTNDHVISGNSEFYIEYNNGEWANASLKGTDSDTDIAILEPDYIPSNTPVLPLQTNNPSFGEPVVAIGSPGGLSNSVTDGVVSSTNVLMEIETAYGIPDTIQTDAALNPGNSGGPLISKSDVAVIGVNRATMGNNIGYAVSSRVAHEVGKDIIEKGSYSHSYTGLQVENINNNDNPLVNTNQDISGVVINDVVDEGPSQKSNLLSKEDGFENPDIITHINGTNINTQEEFLSYLLFNTTPGDEIELSVYRNNNTINTKIELSNRRDYIHN